MISAKGKFIFVVWFFFIKQQGSHRKCKLNWCSRSDILIQYFCSQILLICVFSSLAVKNQRRHRTAKWRMLILWWSCRDKIRLFKRSIWYWYRCKFISCLRQSIIGIDFIRIRWRIGVGIARQKNLMLAFCFWSKYFKFGIIHWFFFLLRGVLWMRRWSVVLCWDMVFLCGDWVKL